MPKKAHAIVLLRLNLMNSMAVVSKRDYFETMLRCKLVRGTS